MLAKYVVITNTGAGAELTYGGDDGAKLALPVSVFQMRSAAVFGKWKPRRWRIFLL